jgi:hypothetical protein
MSNTRTMNATCSATCSATPFLLILEPLPSVLAWIVIVVKSGHGEVRCCGWCMLERLRYLRFPLRGTPLRGNEDARNRMAYAVTDSGRPGRIFVLFDGFLAGSWLGLVVAFVPGIATPIRPTSTVKNLVATVVVGAVLATLCVLVYHAAESGTEPPGRIRAEGQSARNGLLFSARFVAFVVLLSVDITAAVPLVAPLPALLVALLFVLSAVHRSLSLRLAGLVFGILYVLASVLISLARTL